MDVIPVIHWSRTAPIQDSFSDVLDLIDKHNLLFVGASQVVLVVKKQPANAGDTRDVGLIPGLERFSGEFNLASIC